MAWLDKRIIQHKPNTPPFPSARECMPCSQDVHLICCTRLERASEGTVPQGDTLGSYRWSKACRQQRQLGEPEPQSATSRQQTWKLVFM